MFRKISICFLVAILGLTALYAQEEKSSWGVSCDIYSRYIWRGTDFGNNPSIQPGISYTTGPVTLGAWSAWQFSGQSSENDLFVSYSIGSLSFTLTDYFFPTNSGSNDNFFDFDPDSGAHFVEAGASGEFKGVSVYGGIFFHEPGADNSSAYLNLSYGPFSLGLGNGMYTVIDNEDGTDKFDLVEFGITASNGNYRCSWILNPNQETTFLVVGKSF
tara:strand:+ start:21 stop:668 length:648 start_codon:yes stop_codon:yes gene_type:complete